MNLRAVMILAAIVCLAVFMSSPLAAQTITNGNFEAVAIGSPFDSANPANIPGWTHGGSVGDALIWAVGYSDSGGNISVAGSGQQFVTLGGGFGVTGSSSWSTTITGLTPGASYMLNFMIANEGGDAGQDETMTVDFPSGSSTGSQSFTAPANVQNYWKVWLPKSLTFVATASSATVRFSVTNQPFDMGLDNVSIPGAPALTPAPPTLILTLFGLLCGAAYFWWLSRRRVA